MLGLYEGHTPRFVKRYADLRDTALDAIRTYADEVRGHQFPVAQYEYRMADDQLAAFEERLGERASEEAAHRS